VRVVLGVLGVALFAAAAVAGEPGRPGPSRSDPPAPKAAAPEAPQPQGPADANLPEPARIAWRTSAAEALKEAAKADRLVLLAFLADWSQPCAMMGRGTFGSKPVALAIERHFIPVRIDDSKNLSPTSQTYHVRVYPTVLFLTAAGDVLLTVEGTRTPKDFQPILEQVVVLPGLMAAQKEKPDDLEANFALGNGLALLNQVSRAAPYLERAAQLDADNRRGRRSQARLILALAPLEEGDSAAALRLLKQFEVDFKGDPQVPTAVFFQGAVLFQDGKLEEAREVFVRMQKEFPKHPKTYDADKAILAIDGRLKYRKRMEETGAASPKEPSPPAQKEPPPAEKTPPPPAEKPKPKG
jgi:tetratricopeptide (TPR) repeat protein